jgi:exopolysaccharide biosynthesis WecB/TagA/CpsF family protein
MEAILYPEVSSPPIPTDRAASPPELNPRHSHRVGNVLVLRNRGMRVLNTWVDAIPGNEVLALLSGPPPAHPRHLCYVNAHSLNIAYHDKPYQDALSRAHLVLNDGIGLELAARMRGCGFPENLNGSDFTLRLLSLAAEQEWRVYLYGGQPGVAATARDRLFETIEGLQIVGVCDGYDPRTDEEIIEDIRAVGADIVIVALGQPQQELWLDAHLAATGCHVGIGVGAFLDFVSGRVVRAPGWMNRLGIEWMFRLVKEPGRLWRRYIVGNPLFLWRAWRLRTAEWIEAPARLALARLEEDEAEAVHAS